MGASEGNKGSTTMDEQQEPEAPRRRSGINWLGIIAFIVIAFGRRILSFVQWLFAGGSSLLPGSFDLALVLGGGAVVALVVATLVTVRASRRNDTRGPTPPSTPEPRPNAPMPPFGGPSLPTTPTYRTRTVAALPSPADAQPTAPRFEPIINPKVALASGLLALLAGGAVAVLLFGNF